MPFVNKKLSKEELEKLDLQKLKRAGGDIWEINAMRPGSTTSCTVDEERNAYLLYLTCTGHGNPHMFGLFLGEDV